MLSYKKKVEVKQNASEHLFSYFVSFQLLFLSLFCFFGGFKGIQVQKTELKMSLLKRSYMLQIQEKGENIQQLFKVSKQKILAYHHSYFFITAWILLFSLYTYSTNVNVRLCLTDSIVFFQDSTMFKDIRYKFSSKKIEVGWKQT